MQLRPDLRHRLCQATLALIVALCAGLSLTWVFLVPIYQAPDEPAHFDYALAINDHGGLFQGPLASYQQYLGAVHPYTYVLGTRTGTAKLAFHPKEKVPPDYGTPEFYERVNREVPPRDSIQVDTPNSLIAVYPFGYYALLAVWIEMLRFLRDTPIFLFFGSRILSVLLLITSLYLIYGSSRLLNLGPRMALFLTACVGSFPMTSFVSSYIQPDNLCLTLTCLVYYLGLRLRQNPQHYGLTFGLGLAFAGLLVTKLHPFVCVAIPVLMMVLYELFYRGTTWKRIMATVVILFVPAFAGWSVYLWTTWGIDNYYMRVVPVKHSVVHATYWFKLAIVNYFAGGTHDSFWGIFGWMDTPILIHRTVTTEIVQFFHEALAWVVLGLTLLRLEQVASRLIRLVMHGKSRQAIRIVFSNPVLNSYFLFTILMFVAFIQLENRFGAQGRNWFPFMLPIFMVGIVYAPKALLFRPTQIAVSRLLAGGLLLYCVAGSYYAIKTVHKRYYIPESRRESVAQAHSSVIAKDGSGFGAESIVPSRARTSQSIATLK